MSGHTNAAREQGRIDVREDGVSPHYLRACVEEQLELFHALYAAHGIPYLPREQVGEVVLVCSSSRGGSSLLFRELARSEHLLSPRGEHTPFERLYLGGHDSDFLGAGNPDSIVDRPWELLFFDLGVGGPLAWRGAAAAAYRLALETRIFLQWPSLLRPDDVRHAWNGMAGGGAKDASAEAGRRMSFRSRGGNPAKVLERILTTLSQEKGIDPGYYDQLREWWFSEPTEGGPPRGGCFVEEPPFIPVLPRRLPTAEALMRLPLLLKSSISAYRLEFLREFFPAAKLKIIHLTRNPAAAVNGLMDGWHHHGFFSHNVSMLGTRLGIDGYSDVHEWGPHWWNFDLFPGWREFKDAPLERVCAEQWMSAHAHIVNVSQKLVDTTVLQVRHEDMIGGATKRRNLLDQVSDFVGIPSLPASAGLHSEEAVMATVPPLAGRWRSKERQILPALRQAGAPELAETLGYDPRRVKEWI